MNHFLGGKLIATFSTVSLGAGLFASSASIGGKELRAMGNVSGVVTGLISELLALLGLSAKHLLLEPSHPGLKGLKLPGQLCDLSLLITNDLFELSSSLLGSCFPFESPGVHRLPVMGLLAEFDQQAAGFGILKEHAAMLPIASFAFV